MAHSSSANRGEVEFPPLSDTPILNAPTAPNHPPILLERAIISVADLLRKCTSQCLPVKGDISKVGYAATINVAPTGSDEYIISTKLGRNS
jgi:hypothetical protein